MVKNRQQYVYVIYERPLSINIVLKVRKIALFLTLPILVEAEI